jgi:hypothetical protein
MLLVDRRVLRQLPLERKPEDRLARRPDDAPETEHARGLEDVEGAQHVRAEGRLLGVDAGGGDGCEVHDRVGARQALHNLAELGQVGDQGGRRRVDRRREIDAEHVVVVLDQVAHDGAARLPARPGDDDPHGRSLGNDTRCSPANRVPVPSP